MELYERIAALGIGPQGLSGVPVALIPQCAANRRLKFTLDGTGPVQLQPPDFRQPRNDAFPG